MITQRTFYVLLVAFLLIPVLIKRSMGELPILSYLLLGSVLLFIILTGVDLATGAKEAQPLSNFKTPIWSDKIVSSISILCVACSYQTGVFPAYTSMQDKSTLRFSISAGIANAFCGVVYIILGILCLAMFGSELQSNVLLNMATRPGYASIFVRLNFSLVLVTHIPYIFFSTKEAYLVFIDEIRHKSVSEKLEAKIK